MGTDKQESNAPASTVATPRALLKIDWRPRYYECAFAVMGVLYVILVGRTHLPFSMELARVFALKLGTIVLAIYALSLLIIGARMLMLAQLSGVASLKDRTALLALAQPYWSLDYLLRTIRRSAVLLASIYLFLHLKHVVLWLNHANNDLFFWHLDRRLHFGVQPNIWAMTTFGKQHEVAVLVDWLYIKYFPYKLIVTIFFLLELKGRKLTESFVLAYTLLWLLGGLSYLIKPADGPCYAVLLNSSVPEEAQTHVFTFPVVRRLPREYVESYEQAKIWIAKHYQERLWTDRRDFLRGADYPGVFYGISAMPSLHVAAVTMMAIFLWQASALAGALAVLYALIIFFGSFFLQWHYAVDGYIGFLFAVLISLFALCTKPHSSASGTNSPLR